MTQKLLDSSNSRLFLLIIIYIIYLFFGACIFDALETPHEARTIRDLNAYVREFRRVHNSCLTNDELDEFITLISISSSKGISPLRNVSGDQKWTFGQSVFFTGTILTTIGYGNVSPLTKGGKLFCMLFAIIGIPITLILLTSIIERLMIHTRSLINYIYYKLEPFIRNRDCCTINNRPVNVNEIRISFAFVFVVFVLVFLMLIPAAIYSHIEGWSYLNSFYYCFISVTTVGLGDYVPGDKSVQEHRHLYKICSTVYLIIGVLIMVWLLELFSEIPEFNLYQYFTLSKGGDLIHHPTPANTNNANESIHIISNNSNIQNGVDDINGIDLRTRDSNNNENDRNYKTAYDTAIQQDQQQQQQNEPILE